MRALLLLLLVLALVAAACQAPGPPVAVDDEWSLDVAEAVTIDVLANDFSAVGELTLIEVLDVQGGTARIANGAVVFMPAEIFTGPRTFTYTVRDGAEPAVEDRAKVTVYVDNGPPRAADGALEVAEGSTENVALSDHYFDPDGDPLTLEIVEGPRHGDLRPAPDGSYSYSHDGSETAEDSFVYRVDDGEYEAFAEMQIAVLPVNDPPVASDDAFEVAAEECVSGNVLANDDDVDSPRLTAALVGQPPSGRVSLEADGSFEFCPQRNDDPEGSSRMVNDEFVYRVDDGAAASTAVVRLSIEVPPVAADDTEVVREGGDATFDVLENDRDDNGDRLEVTRIVSEPSSGEIQAINPDGTIDYRHDGSESRVDRFIYEISDGRFTSEALVRVEVEAVNDPPIAVLDTLAIDAGAVSTRLNCFEGNVLANDLDPDDAVLEAELLDGVALPRFDGDGSFTYCSGRSVGGILYVRYAVTDGRAGDIGHLKIDHEVRVGCSSQVEIAFLYSDAENPLEILVGDPERGAFGEVQVETDQLQFLTYQPDYRDGDGGFVFSYQERIPFEVRNETFSDQGEIRISAFCAPA